MQLKTFHDICISLDNWGEGGASIIGQTDDMAGQSMLMGSGLLFLNSFYNLMHLLNKIPYNNGLLKVTLIPSLKIDLHLC